MLGYVVIVGVEHDEQACAVGVIVISAGGRPAVFGGVGVVEMIGVIRIQRVVVTDGSCFGQRGQDAGGEIPRIFLLLGLSGLIHLVAGGDHGTCL